jgi:hypothetical protein
LDSEESGVKPIEKEPEPPESERGNPGVWVDIGVGKRSPSGGMAENAPGVTESIGMNENRKMRRDLQPLVEKQSGVGGQVSIEPWR